MSMGGSNMQGNEGANIFRQPAEPWHLTTIAAAIIATVGIVDLLTSNTNLAILYALPLVICAHAGRRSWVAVMALASIVLTYAGYFLGPRHTPTTTLADMLANYRLFNRSLCAGALLSITAVAYLYMNVRSRLEARAAADAHAHEAGTDHEYVEVLGIFEQLTATIVCVLLIVWVALLDFVSPREFNLSILYVVPLISLLWVRSRKLLWVIFTVLFACTFVGLGWEQRTVADYQIMETLLRNRVLAATVLLGCTTLLHFAMRPTTTMTAAGKSQSASMVSVDGEHTAVA